MLIDIGFDILKFKRIEKIWFNYGLKFAKKVLSKYEIVNFPDKKYIINYIAKRFSVKESFSKAVGTGFRKNINWHEISLYKNKLGKPFLFFHGKTKNFLSSNNIKKCNVTMSDENDYIFSFVIIEYKKNTYEIRKKK